MQRSSEEEDHRYLRTSNMLNKVHHHTISTLVMLVLSASAVMSGFSQTSAKRNPTERSYVTDLKDDTPVVAYIGNTPIRQDQVDRYAGREIDELTKRLYLLRSQALNSMIDSMVLRDEAARRHIDADQLLQLEIKAPHVPPSDEVEREWTNNYNSLKALGEVGGHYQVVLNIESHKRSEELREYLDHLRDANHVSLLLKPPVIRLQGRPGGNIIGNLAGARELVIFQDYECPFCRQFEPQLESALQKSGGLADLKVTIKQFPLPQHKGAFDAAVAVECASEQERFRPMHDLLIANQDHSAEGLNKSASQAGLNLTMFKECMTGDSARLQVRLDMEEARKNAVEGTPTLFLKGQQIDLPDNPQDLWKMLEANSQPVQESSASNAATSSNSTR